jgi:hypothetical protein
MYDVEALREWRAARLSGADDTFGLAEERAKLARVQREKIEMDLAVRTGDLVAREDVIAQGRAVVGAVKARLLSLPRQAVLRGVILREHEPALKALVFEALREMARWKDLEPAQGAEASPAGPVGQESPLVPGSPPA